MTVIELVTNHLILTLNQAFLMSMQRIPPRTLYKYMPATRTAFFEDWLIRFSQPRALNDPFEMRPHITGYASPEEMLDIATQRWERAIRDEYESLVRKQTNGAPISFDIFRTRLLPKRDQELQEALLQAPQYTPKMVEHIDKTLDANVCALSLCEHSDNALMWSHYANSHRGFVIEFDSTSPFFNQTSPHARFNATPEARTDFAREYGRLRPIEYLEHRPSVLVTEMSFDILFTKHITWLYEHEWRMLMPPQYADETRKDDNGLPLYLFTIPASTVKAIILGCNVEEELTKQALLLRLSPETAHIRIEKARMDERHFKLQFEPVS